MWFSAIHGNTTPNDGFHLHFQLLIYSYISTSTDFSLSKALVLLPSNYLTGIYREPKSVACQTRIYTRRAAGGNRHYWGTGSDPFTGRPAGTRSGKSFLVHQ